MFRRSRSLGIFHTDYKLTYLSLTISQKFYKKTLAILVKAIAVTIEWHGTVTLRIVTS